VLALHGDAAGKLWVGTDAGIDVRDVAGAFRHVDLAAVPGGGAINAIAFLEADDAMLVGTRRGVLRVGADLRASVLADTGLSDRVVYGLARDGDGALWIATRDGLDRRTADGRLDAYAQNTAVPGSLPGRKLFDALTDREGSLWIASTDGGIAQLPAQWRNFALFRHDPADAASLSDNRVQGLAADAEGRLWTVNLAGGIDRLDPATGAVERYGERWTAPEKALWSVLADRAGRIWVGHPHGLRVYELQSGQWRDVPAAGRGDALLPGVVDLLVEAPDGAVWASANGGGVQRIDASTLAVARYGDEAGLRSADVGQIGFAPDGALLVASAAGLDRLDSASARFAAVAGAPAERVLAFAFAPDGSLWLHTIGALAHYRYRGTALAPLDRYAAAEG